MDNGISPPEVGQFMLKPDELAKRWRKPTQWIYSNWRSLGLKPVKLNRQLRFKVEEIIEFELAQQR